MLRAGVGLSLAAAMATAAASATAASEWKPMPVALRSAVERAERTLSLRPPEPAEGGASIRRIAVGDPRDTMVASYQGGQRRPAMMIWTREVLTGRLCRDGRPGATVWLFAAKGNRWIANRVDSCSDQARPAPQGVRDDQAFGIAMEVLLRLAKAAAAPDGGASLR